MKNTLAFLTLLSLLGSPLPAQTDVLRERMVGSAFLGNASFALLERLADEAGGRWIGTAQNELGMRILVEELRRLGLEPRLEAFTAPGWVRGADEVRMLEPSQRVLRAIALGYVERTPAFEARVVWGNRGAQDDLEAAKGALALVTQEPERGKPALLRGEVIANAAAVGARAVLFMNHKQGGMLLAGMSNHVGEAAPIPAFSITWEEGRRLQRLIERKVRVVVRVRTESRCVEVQSANVVVTLPGRRPERVVVGAHLDSWDLGQGAIDNGLGTAILFDVARILGVLSPQNERTVELVWFNGEEMGLWGARRYVERHGGEAIVAMVNMDMTGSPRGINVMGNDHLEGPMEALVKHLGGFYLSRGVASVPWTNSDHQPFMLAGIPVITPLAHLDREMVDPYHDFGDTFDLVNKKYLSEAAAVVAVLTHELASNLAIPLVRREFEETREWLIRYGLEPRLRRQREWPFGEAR